MQITLRKMISAAHAGDDSTWNPELVKQIKAQDGKLTYEQQCSLFQMLCTGLRRENRSKLDRRVELPLVLWPSYGIFGRVHLSADGQSFIYCAGQSYPDEIREVRKLILEG